MIVIIDYGLGNLRSVFNGLRKNRAEVRISSEIQEIERADKLVLPGVGSFSSGMENLQQRNLIPVLIEKVLQQRTPILGICLGMQLFTKRSEEADCEGLGWIEGESIRFTRQEGRRQGKIPHIGWSSVNITRDSRILKGIPSASEFYFLHSYYVLCDDPAFTVATTDYGDRFTSVIEVENIYGTQFHPEKSHAVGKQLLKNFLDLP